MNLIELMTTRRTYRRFAQTPVPQEVIADIVEALRLSSSGRNRQGVRLLLAEKPADIAAISENIKWAGALPPGVGTPKQDERPTLFAAVLVDTSVGCDAEVDMGIAMANMTLAAWNHGVGSCILAAINRPVLTQYFALPETKTLQYIIAFGYPSHLSHIVEKTPDSPLYYLDESRNYCVPKHNAETLATKL